ncbi:UvrD-helicase domain-containing protein [Tepidiforma sp.]|uniref:UvrD-helicase domain-containing protein n=1 Tax=Tepidiforma sp. TaxID=2682230 RepID=UPI002ADD53DD|nr:UvrD-helicase domain-containing protein [Tepidiforma sp.]
MGLRDASARERAVGATGETLFVEAGAGAGKTTALVDRIVRLVAEGASVEQIAAITFTEKAAAELSDRVRQRLEEAAEGSGAFASWGDVARRRCRGAAEGLDGASFQTIHAFARRILASYPVQAGLPPEFDVLDEAEEEIDLREQLRRLLDALESDEGARGPLALAYTLRLQPRHVRGLAREFARNWDRLRVGGFELPRVEPDWEPPLLELLDGIEPEATTPQLATHLEELRSFAERLAAAYGRYLAAGSGERERRLVEMLTLATRAPRFKTGVGKGRPLVRVKEAYEAWLGEIRSWALARLLPRIQAFALEYAEERRRAGRVTFHDLLVLAVDLLRGDAEVRRALHRRFAYLLVDEFQDTDPLQVELAALIAGEPGEVCAWQEASVAQGRLFFVGDPKQSIYRFRRADIRIYLSAKGAFDAEHEQLTTNFRSTRAIVRWVNAVCGRLFAGDGAGGYQAPWVPLDVREDAPVGVPVRVFGGMRERSAAEVDEEEARDVALGVLRARAENWAGEERGTRFGDITILLPRRTTLGALERALADRGIPYRIESRSLLFASEEARDLAAVLLAIDDPTDQVALVAALRSPLFACQDGELAAHVRAGGRWTYEAAPPAESPERVRRALERLALWHRERWGMSAAGLIERVVGDCHLLLVAVGDPRPREAWRRYRLLAEMARSLTVRGAVGTLRQFVDWLERQREEEVQVNEAIVSEPDDDAVRIMTIHAAKGLEFPVVFVTGLGKEGRPNRTVSVFWPPEGSGRLPEVRCGGREDGFATAGAAELEQEEEFHQSAEDVRLLYVAVTRAARALAVSLYRTKRRDGGSLASQVEAALEVAPAGSWEELGRQDWDAVGEVSEEQVARFHAVPPRDEWLRRREEVVARYAKAPVVAGTAVARAAAPEVPEEGEETMAPPGEPWRKGRAGTSIGRAVHAVLQSIDLATGEGLEAAALAHAEAEGVADRAEEVQRLAERALGSEVVRAAAASGRFWREVYVGAEVGGVVIEGFIDLVYEGPDGLVIVDYKTDSLRGPEEVAVAMARYRLQGAVYALAAERAVGRPVARVVFVFTEPRVDREVEDLEGAKVEALGLAQGLVGSARG